MAVLIFIYFFDNIKYLFCSFCWNSCFWWLQCTVGHLESAQIDGHIVAMLDHTFQGRCKYMIDNLIARHLSTYIVHKRNFPFSIFVNASEFGISILMTSLTSEIAPCNCLNLQKIAVSAICLTRYNFPRTNKHSHSQFKL